MLKATKWSVDQSQSEITFKVRHLMIAHVKGLFKIFDANIYTVDRDFTTADIDLWIDANSITTGDSKRDEHLKSAEFLNVKTHKQINFRSNTIGRSDVTGVYELWGELTITGITKNIKLDIGFGGILKDPWGNEKAGFKVTGKINKREWELNWNTVIEAGGLMVGEEIAISCEIELTNIGPEDVIIDMEPPWFKQEIL